MALYLKKTSSAWTTVKSVYVKASSSAWKTAKAIYVKTSSGWTQFWPTSLNISTKPTLTETLNSDYTIKLTATSYNWKTNPTLSYDFQWSTDGTSWQSMQGGFISTTNPASGSYNTYTINSVSSAYVSPNKNNYYQFVVKATTSTEAGIATSNQVSFQGTTDITVTASAASSSSINVSWTSSLNASRYMVWYQSSYSGTYTIIGTGGTSITLTGLTPDTNDDPFYIFVQPWTGSNNSSGYSGNYSNTVAVTLPSVPNTPTNLSITPLYDGLGTVRVSWTNPTIGAPFTNFVLQYIDTTLHPLPQALSNYSTLSLGTTSPVNVVVTTPGSPIPNHHYDAYIYAVNSVGSGPISNEASFSNGMLQGLLPTFGTPVSAPTTLNIGGTNYAPAVYVPITNYSTSLYPTWTASGTAGITFIANINGQTCVVTEGGSPGQTITLYASTSGRSGYSSATSTITVRMPPGTPSYAGGTYEGNLTIDGQIQCSVAGADSINYFIERSGTGVAISGSVSAGTYKGYGNNYLLYQGATVVSGSYVAYGIPVNGYYYMGATGQNSYSGTDSNGMNYTQVDQNNFSTINGPLAYSTDFLSNDWFYNGQASLTAPSGGSAAISGNTTVGSTLTCTVSNASGNPTPTYTITWSDGETGATATPAAAGNYYATVVFTNSQGTQTVTTNTITLTSTIGTYGIGTISTGIGTISTGIGTISTGIGTISTGIGTINTGYGIGTIGTINTIGTIGTIGTINTGYGIGTIGTINTIGTIGTIGTINTGYGNSLGFLTNVRTPDGLKPAHLVQVGDALLSANMINVPDVNQTDTAELAAWSADQNPVGAQDITYVTDVHSRITNVIVVINGEYFSDTHYVMVQRDGKTIIVPANTIDENNDLIWSYANQEWQKIGSYAIITSAYYEVISITTSPNAWFYTEDMLVYDSPAPLPGSAEIPSAAVNVSLGFPEGTRVQMADGSYQNIETITIGDEIMSASIPGFDSSSKDPENMAWASESIDGASKETTTVMNTWIISSTSYLLINNGLPNGNIAVGSNSYVFAKINNVWQLCQATDLVVGASLINNDLTENIIETISVVNADTNTIALDTADSDIYFIEGMLVNNFTIEHNG